MAPPVALLAAPNKGHELPAAQKLLRSEAVNLFLFTSSFLEEVLVAALPRWEVSQLDTISHSGKLYPRDEL